MSRKQEMEDMGLFFALHGAFADVACAAAGPQAMSHFQYTVYSTGKQIVFCLKHVPSTTSNDAGWEHDLSKISKMFRDGGFPFSVYKSRTADNIHMVLTNNISTLLLKDVQVNEFLKFHDNLMP